MFLNEVMFVFTYTFYTKYEYLERRDFYSTMIVCFLFREVLKKKINK